MWFINVAHEHFITQAGRTSKPALKIFMDRGTGGLRANMWGLGPTAEEKQIPPKQVNLKSKLPRGSETDILHWNIVYSSISSHK